MDVRICYTPTPDRAGQTVRFVAYLTTPGTAAVDTMPGDPATNGIANGMIGTLNLDSCKVIMDRVVNLVDAQNGAEQGGTKKYPGYASTIIQDFTGWDLATGGQVPSRLLTFKIPINRKLTYASNTLLLGNNCLNLVVIPYEAYGTLVTDNIAKIEASLTLNFKDAP